jgi:hypothetical protein
LHCGWRYSLWRITLGLEVVFCNLRDKKIFCHVEMYSFMRVFSTKVMGRKLDTTEFTKHICFGAQQTCFIMMWDFSLLQILTFCSFSFPVTWNVHSSLKITCLGSKTVGETGKPSVYRKWGRNIKKKRHKWCHSTLVEIM